MSTGTALPPHLRARYGLDRRPTGTRILVVLLVAAFVGALVFVGWAISRPKVDSALLSWDEQPPDRVDVTFEVRRTATDDVQCVLRAQDDERADVGYAVVDVPPGAAYERITYRLRTLAPALVVEVLGCDVGAPPARAPKPQFPPGVVPPDQPWTP